MENDAITVILNCLSFSNDAVKIEQLDQTSPEIWRSVAAMAQRQGVAPLLHQRLTRLRINLPDDVAEELKHAYLTNITRNMRLYRALNKVLLRLQEKSIPVIVLKGAHLAEIVYGNIGLRPMGDIDLIVKKDDLARMEQELLEIGSTPCDFNRVISVDNHHFSYKLPNGGPTMEVHWVLFDSKFPFQVDLEEMWARTQSVSIAEVTAQVLSPIDLLLHLCLHTAKHAHDMQIKMLFDIGEVIRYNGPDLVWNDVSVRAQEWGIGRSVYMILRLAQELLNVPVPADWLASLRPINFDERYLAIARQQMLDTHDYENNTPTIQSVQLWEAKGFGRKLALLRDSLMLSRESMSLMYPASSNSWRIYLYYFVRIKDVLARHGKQLWRLLRDPKTRAAAESINQVTNLRDWLLSN